MKNKVCFVICHSSEKQPQLHRNISNFSIHLEYASMFLLSLVRTIAGCNRTYYGNLGITYDLELHRPKEDKIPYVCELNFTAAGGQHGDIIQVSPWAVVCEWTYALVVYLWQMIMMMMINTMIIILMRKTAIWINCMTNGSIHVYITCPTTRQPARATTECLTNPTFLPRSRTFTHRSHWKVSRSVVSSRTRWKAVRMAACRLPKRLVHQLAACGADPPGARSSSTAKRVRSYWRWNFPSESHEPSFPYVWPKNVPNFLSHDPRSKYTTSQHDNHMLLCYVCRVFAVIAQTLQGPEWLQLWLSAAVQGAAQRDGCCPIRWHSTWR